MSQNENRKAIMMGSGIGSLTAAFFLLRDAKYQGKNITIYEALDVPGGALDAAGSAEKGYVLRGIRMFTPTNFECMYDMFKDVPSVKNPNQSVTQDLLDFMDELKTYNHTRLVNGRGMRIDAKCLKLSWANRMQLMTLQSKTDDEIGSTKITDWFDEDFFLTNFWSMWQTMFAFHDWSSAIEMRRYMDRFIHLFTNIETMQDIVRTPNSQYQSLVVPLVKLLKEHGVKFEYGCTVVDIDVEAKNETFTAKSFKFIRNKKEETIQIQPEDLLLIQNGSITDATSVGTMKEPAKLLGANESTSFKIWEKLAKLSPVWGNPEKFISNTAESMWQSFTITINKNPGLLKAMEDFQKTKAGTGCAMTFTQSNWRITIGICQWPQLDGQQEGVHISWGYGIYCNRVGNFVPKRMIDCSGEEIFYEISQWMRIPPQHCHSYTCVPIIMPYITAQFMPRQVSDRPVPFPKGSKNIVMASQFVEVPKDIVFTVDYSIRAAQVGIYDYCNIRNRPIVPVSNYLAPKYKLKAAIKTFASGLGPEALRGKKSSCTKKVLCLGLIGVCAAFLMKNLM